MLALTLVDEKFNPDLFAYGKRSEQEEPPNISYCDDDGEYIYFHLSEQNHELLLTSINERWEMKNAPIYPKQTLKECIQYERPGRLFFDFKMTYDKDKNVPLSIAIIKEVHARVLTRFISTASGKFGERQKSKIYSRWYCAINVEDKEVCLRGVFPTLILAQAYKIPFTVEWIMRATTNKEITDALVKYVENASVLHVPLPLTGNWRPLNKKDWNKQCMYNVQSNKLVERDHFEQSPWMILREMMIQGGGQTLGPFPSEDKLDTDYKKEMKNIPPPPSAGLLEDEETLLLMSRSVDDIMSKVLANVAEIKDLDMGLIYDNPVDSAEIHHVEVPRDVDASKMHIWDWTLSVNFLREAVGCFVIPPNLEQQKLLFANAIKYIQTRACLLKGGAGTVFAYKKFLDTNLKDADKRIIKQVGLAKDKSFTEVIKRDSVKYKCLPLDKEGNPSEKCWWTWWEIHAAAKYEDVCYEPVSYANRDKRELKHDNMLNLFQGFACWSWNPLESMLDDVPDWSFKDPESLQKLIHHEKYKDTLGFFLNHMYDKWMSGSHVQTMDMNRLFIQWIFRPDVPSNKCPVLTGQQGVGKTSAYSVIFTFMGTHWWKTNKSKELTSDFNEHFLDKTFVLLEEGKVSKTAGELETLKDVMTSEVQRTETKYGAIRNKNVKRNYAMNGNNVSVLAEEDQRRFWYQTMLPFLQTKEAKKLYGDKLISVCRDPLFLRQYFTFLYYLFHKGGHDAWMAELPGKMWRNLSYMTEILRSMQYGDKAVLVYLWEYILGPKALPGQKLSPDALTRWLEGNQTVVISVKEFIHDFTTKMPRSGKNLIPSHLANNQLVEFIAATDQVNETWTLKSYAQCNEILSIKFDMDVEDLAQLRKQKQAQVERLASSNNVDAIPSVPQTELYFERARSDIKNGAYNYSEHHEQFSEFRKQILGVASAENFLVIANSDPAAVAPEVVAELKQFLKRHKSVDAYDTSNDYLQRELADMREHVKLFSGDRQSKQPSSFIKPQPVGRSDKRSIASGEQTQRYKIANQKAAKKKAAALTVMPTEVEEFMAEREQTNRDIRANEFGSLKITKSTKDNESIDEESEEEDSHLSKKQKKQSSSNNSD